MAKLAIDANGKGIQALRPTSTQKVTISGTASSFTAVAAGVNVVRIVASADIHYYLEGTATTSQVFLPSGTVEYLRVQAGDVISVIGTGDVYVTEAD